MQPDQRPPVCDEPKRARCKPGERSQGARLVLAPRVRRHFQQFQRLVDIRQLIWAAEYGNQRWGLALGDEGIEFAVVRTVMEATKHCDQSRKLSSLMADRACADWLPNGLHEALLCQVVADEGPSCALKSWLLVGDPLLWLCARRVLFSPWAQLGELDDSWRLALARDSRFQFALEGARELLAERATTLRGRRMRRHDVLQLSDEVYQRFEAGLHADRARASAAFLTRLEHYLQSRPAGISRQLAACLGPERRDQGGETGWSCICWNDQAKLLAQWRQRITQAILPKLAAHLRVVAAGQWLEDKSLAEIAREQGLAHGTVNRYAFDLRRYFDSNNFELLLNDLARQFGCSCDHLVDMINGHALMCIGQHPYHFKGRA